MKRVLKFASYSMWVEKRQNYDWYNWCVFVAESDETISRIERVEYKLHPTFPDPLRTVIDRNTHFALFSSGWGEFRIDIRVYFNDGEIETKSYDLKLARDSWPRGERPVGLLEPNAQRVYDALADPSRRWRKLTTLSTSTGLPMTEVESILSDLELKHLVRRSQSPSLDDKDLWGATSLVGLPPRE